MSAACPNGHALADGALDTKGRCRECGREASRRYYRANIERFRKRDRRREREPMRRRSIERRWGMTFAEYEALLARGCAICGTHESLVLDHAHAPGDDRNLKVGTVREALCSQCNVALGMMGEDVKRLRGAIDYLERHRV